jgi:choline dehydrogenase-like flavoprotein
MAKSDISATDINWFYHSGIPEGVKITDRLQRQLHLPPGSAAAEQFAEVFVIEFVTEQFAPNHCVTLRTEVDGWGRDLHGAYVEGRWKFFMEKSRYPQGLMFKFFLDGGYWATGANLSIATPADVAFHEHQIQFPKIESRYRHYYDNLLTGDGEISQRVMHSNYDETIPYDLIVVGSGAAGGVLGLEAAQRGMKVLILDMGRLETSTHSFNLPNAGWGGLESRFGVVNYDKVDGNTKIGGYPNMNFGGRSIYWYGIIPRMKDWEFAFWPQAIAHDLKTGGYDAAESLVRKHITTGQFQEGVIASLEAMFPNHEVCDTPRAESQPDIGQASFIEQSTGTFSSAELLYDALTATGPLGRDNLSVNLNHLVTRLEWHGRKITGVVCQDLVGNRERVYRGARFVLAAGSTQTPRIALRSQLNDPSNRTGVGLTDHGSFFAGYDEVVKFVIPANSTYAGNDKYARIFLYADPNAQHRFNTEIELNPDYFRIRHANRAYWQHYLQTKGRTTVQLKATCATPLLDSNYVQLAQNPDDKVRLQMLPSAFGSEAADTVRAQFARLLNFFGVQGFDLSKPEQFGFGNHGTPSHAGGTMRMSANGTGVTNSDLRHESYDNLYVCDASVFPFIPAVNPTLTLVALAQRLARHIASLPGSA